MSLLRPNSEEQDMRELLARFFSEQITSEYLRKRVEQSKASDPELDAKLSELGLFDLVAAEGKGDFAQLAVIAFESARVLCPENIIDNLYFGPYFASRFSKSLPSALIAGMASGEKRVAGAILETDSTSSKKQGLSGTLRLVPGVECAQLLLLLEPSGAGYLAQAPFALNPEECLDRTIKRSAVQLDGLSLTKLSGLENAAQGLFILRALELSGVAQRAVNMTVEYVKLRKQFDRPVGSFQAVQHRLSDMYLKSEAMRSLAFFAAWAFTHSPEQIKLAAQSALSIALANASVVVEGAIQLHGGIGFTWEYDLQFYLRRAKSIEALYAGYINDQALLQAV